MFPLLQGEGFCDSCGQGSIHPPGHCSAASRVFILLWPLYTAQAPEKGFGTFGDELPPREGALCGIRALLPSWGLPVPGEKDRLEKDWQRSVFVFQTVSGWAVLIACTQSHCTKAVTCCWWETAEFIHMCKHKRKKYTQQHLLHTQHRWLHTTWKLCGSNRTPDTGFVQNRLKQGLCMHRREQRETLSQHD